MVDELFRLMVCPKAGRGSPKDPGWLKCPARNLFFLILSRIRGMLQFMEAKYNTYLEKDPNLRKPLWLEHPFHLIFMKAVVVRRMKQNDLHGRGNPIIWVTIPSRLTRKFGLVREIDPKILTNKPVCTEAAALDICARVPTVTDESKITKKRGRSGTNVSSGRTMAYYLSASSPSMLQVPDARARANYFNASSSSMLQVSDARARANNFSASSPRMSAARASANPPLTVPSTTSGPNHTIDLSTTSDDYRFKYNFQYVHTVLPPPSGSWPDTFNTIYLTRKNKQSVINTLLLRIVMLVAIDVAITKKIPFQEIFGDFTQYYDMVMAFVVWEGNPFMALYLTKKQCREALRNLLKAKVQVSKFEKPSDVYDAAGVQRSLTKAKLFNWSCAIQFFSMPMFFHLWNLANNIPIEPVIRIDLSSFTLLTNPQSIDKDVHLDDTDWTNTLELLYNGYITPELLQDLFNAREYYDKDRIEAGQTGTGLNPRNITRAGVEIRGYPLRANTKFKDKPKSRGDPNYWDELLNLGLTQRTENLFNK